MGDLPRVLPAKAGRKSLARPLRRAAFRVARGAYMGDALVDELDIHQAIRFARRPFPDLRLLLEFGNERGRTRTEKASALLGLAECE